MIESSIELKQGAKSKIEDLLIVKRENLKSKANNKTLRARTCTAIFVVFLKCTLESDLGASNTLINVESEPNKSEVHLNCPVDINREKLGSSQEIKFQGPEEA